MPGIWHAAFFATPYMNSDHENGIYAVSHIRYGVIQFLIGRGISAFLGLTVALLLVRYMPVKDYAVFATLVGVQIFVVAMVSLGLDRIISRFIPVARLKSDTRTLAKFVWWLLALRMAALAVAILPLLALTPTVAIKLNAAGYESAFYATWVFTFLFGLSQHAMRSLQALMEQVAVKWAQFWEFLPRLLLILGWILANHSVIGVAEALWIFAACSGVGLLLQAVSLRRCLSAVRQVESPWQLPTGKIFHTGWHNFTQTLLLLPSEAPSLRLIGAYFLLAPAMAAYGFFQTLIGTVRRYLPIQLLLDISEPVIFARYSQSGDFRQLNATTNSMLKINAYVLLPLIGWLLVVGEPTVSLLTGGKYLEYAWVPPILVAALLYESHWIVLRVVVNAVGQANLLAKGGLGALVGVAVLVAMLSWQSEHGLLILSLGVLCILSLQNFLVVRGLRHAGQAYGLDGRGLARLALAATIASGLGWGIKLAFAPGQLTVLLLTFVVMSPTYIMLVRKTRVFDEGERAMLGRLNRKLAWFV